MLESVISLVSYGYYGGTFGDVLQQWEAAGIFAYVLPFLLVFAMVYGILSKTKIFEDNRAVNAIIALVIGLMSLQFGMVPLFFAEVLPRLGVGLASILVFLILAGMFIPENVDWVKYAMLTIGVVVAIIVLTKSFSFIGWTTGGWWTQNWGTIAGLIFILAVIGAVVNSGKEGNKAKTYSDHIRIPYFGNQQGK